MPTPIAAKLKIKEGMTLLALHAPKNFEDHLQPLPDGVQVKLKSKAYDQIHWFIKDQAQLNEELDQVMQLLTEGVTCWTYYPKGTSKVQTDLTRDKGWDKLMKHSDLQFLTLISFDETWSAFGFRRKTAGDVKKDSRPKEREIFKYIDAAKKIVYLPEDLKAALDNDREAKSVFEKLAFSHKKEYVEWIVTAKKEETRKTRIEGTIERIHKGWKNPRNM